MAYQEGDEKKYFPSVLAILVLLAAAIGYFVYSLVDDGIGDFEPLYEESELGVNPGPGMKPTSAPNVEPPTFPPPSN